MVHEKKAVADSFQGNGSEISEWKCKEDMYHEAVSRNTHGIIFFQECLCVTQPDDRLIEKTWYLGERFTAKARRDTVWELIGGGLFCPSNRDPAEIDKNWKQWRWAAYVFVVTRKVLQWMKSKIYELIVWNMDG